MKTFLSLSVLCLILGYAGQAAAQDAAPAKPSMQDRMLSSLTPAEKAQFEAAQTKAFADNPALKTEQDSMMAQGMAMRSGTPTSDDKMAFHQKMKDHNEKMKAAMLKEDSSLQPVFDKIEKARAEMRAKHAQQGGAGAGGPPAAK